jgi:nucleoid DNA-binding protein
LGYFPAIVTHHFFQTLKETLERGEKVKISEFGNFSTAASGREREETPKRVRKY